jgi:hypothetical protein
LRGYCIPVGAIVSSAQFPEWRSNMKRLLIAFVKTLHVTSENVTFAGCIAIAIDSDFALFKIALTTGFFILTIILKFLILGVEEKGGRS